jgi:hypothetical protein
MPKSTLIWFYQGYVRASHACKLPIAPMGTLLTLTHACITAANAPVDYRVYVSQRPSKVRIAPMGDSTHILLVVCTGRRCPRQWWLSDHLIVHHQWEHSILCACKSSHGPNGKIADVLASTHACTTANASVNYRGCVLQRH